MAICSPLGDHITAFLILVLFSPIEKTIFLVCMSPMSTRRSPLAEAIRRLSGDQATENICPLCSLRVSVLRVKVERRALKNECFDGSLVGSQMCTARSLPAEATHLPSGDHAILWILSLCSVQV